MMRSQQFEAIPTDYTGLQFRSKLEARWAVFLDHLRIEWVYEPQRFHHGNCSYLPDFYLPNLKTWIEVKGSDEMLAECAETMKRVFPPSVARS